jgi:hypothetical protein
MNPVGKMVQKRLSDYQFYVDCLTPLQRSTLADRYLLKVPERYRQIIRREASLHQLAFCEVFSLETYGW